MSCDVLIFVEDPGAANYIADLPALLNQMDITSILMVDGHATDFLLKRGISGTQINNKESVKERIEYYRPKLIMVGTSENIETIGFDFITNAREMGIKTISWVDAYSNYEYRFRGNSNNSLEYASDLLLVTDELTKESYTKLGYDAENIFVCGNPSHDKIFEIKKDFDAIGHLTIKKKLFPIAYEKKSKVVTFIAESSVGLHPEQYEQSSEYTLKGWGGSTKRTEIVLEEFLDGIKSLSVLPYMVLRLHPKNNIEEFDNYIPYFDFVSQNESPLEVVYASDLVVGMASSLVLESFLLGKQTLSILPKKCEKNWLEPINTGVIPCAITTEEIRAYMLNLPEDYQAASQHNSFITNNALNRISKIIKDKLKF